MSPYRARTPVTRALRTATVTLVMGAGVRAVCRERRRLEDESASRDITAGGFQELWIPHESPGYP